MIIDGERLINYIQLMRQDMSTRCKREIDYILEEIEEGSFNYPTVDDYLEQRMWIFERIAGERENQDRLHEFPDHIRLAVLMEEVGEIAEELQKKERNKVYLLMELIQTAAVCVRWIERLETES